MDNKVKILLLKIIKFNGDITPLLKLGYEYSQIVQAIKDEIDEGNAERKNGVLCVTDKGNNIIENISKEQKRKNSDEWIEPEIESQIPKIPIDFVYLPNQNELTFRYFE